MEQGNEYLIKSMEETIEKKRAQVALFNTKGTNQLLTIMLDDISKFDSLENDIAKVYNRIEENYDLREKLLYQKELTRKDIIDENIIKIYLMYNAILAATWVTSADMLVFIKNFLMCSGIGVSTFLANLKYFTGDFHHQLIVLKVASIEAENAAYHSNLIALEKARDMYLELLKFEAGKLYHIANNKKYSYDGIDKLFKDLKMAFLIPNMNSKKRIRRK